MKLGLNLAYLKVAPLVAASLLLTHMAHGAEQTVGDNENDFEIVAWLPLIIAESLWLILVGVIAPTYAALAKSELKEPRGLNLPRGSVRSILALLIVGSFVNVLVFAPMAGRELDTVITTFGTLTGSVVGFYFGSRTAQ